MGAETVTESTMRLRHGFNETLGWRHLALGSHRERLQERFRAMGTSVMRILLFDPRGPNPAAEWDPFAAYVQAVLNAGAVPMITFSKFGPPYDDPQAVRWFTDQCADIVRKCIEQWGGEAVRDWFWCVWNQPNSDWVSAGLTFEHYHRIYEEVADGILHHLAPHLAGRKPLLGGPAVDGFQPFWMDWVWRLVHEIDNTRIGFVSWHCYGDWREPGTWGAPNDETIFEALLMARAAEYQSRARAVGRLLQGRGILNVCGELNAHSHHEVRVSRRFNQSVFGAAFYVSALLRLIRGGADLEMFWTGTDDLGPYGVMNTEAAPTPLSYVKELFARYVRFGDRLTFPATGQDARDLEVAMVRGPANRTNVLLVHRKDRAATYALSELTGGIANGRRVLQIDRSTADRLVERRFDGTVTFEGYGVAAVEASS